MQLSWKHGLTPGKTDGLGHHVGHMRAGPASPKQEGNCPNVTAICHKKMKINILMIYIEIASYKCGREKGIRVISLVGNNASGSSAARRRAYPVCISLYSEKKILNHTCCA